MIGHWRKINKDLNIHNTNIPEYKKPLPINKTGKSLKEKGKGHEDNSQKEVDNELKKGG
jgi:hypothetical protein